VAHAAKRTGEALVVPSELGDAFAHLDNVLGSGVNLWQPQPFTCDDLPWGTSQASLKEALLELSDVQTEQLHDDPELRVQWMEQHAPELCAALSAYTPSIISGDINLSLKPRDDKGMPDRKWRQITSFASALPQYDLPLVDWCAGKGHLSRVVQRSQQQTVHCMEWDASLVAIGRALAAKQQQDIQYHQHDVMNPLPSSCASAGMVHIGLHACGQLHHQLLLQATSVAASAISLSPCCYHKTDDDFYQPLSAAAKQSDLVLDRSLLHLAVQETVTARHGERVLRKQERQWRLGFDALQREVRGVDQYLTVPSCKRSILRQGFSDFCQWAASRRQISLPANIDYDRYLQRGRRRHQQVVRLELLRQLFSRPLELWLVLDCALYLEEQGYQVTVHQFCDRKTSPRNLLIRGEKL
jgi:hypothetical protein